MVAQGKEGAKTSTIFIRGLPDTYTDDALKTIFTPFGDIRSAFIVKAKGQNGSRGAGSGLGYVKYKTVQEADKAIAATKMIDNQKVVIVHARKKPRKFRKPAPEKPKEKDDSGLDDTESEGETPAKKDEKIVPAKVAADKEGLEDSTLENYIPLNPSRLEPLVEKKKEGKSKKTKKEEKPSKKEEKAEEPVPEPVAPVIKAKKEVPKKFPKNDKTIFINHLAAGVTKNDVRKKCRKIGAVKDVFVDGSTAAVTFADKNIAKAAIKKLHNHVYKQQVITVVPSTLSPKALLKLSTPSRVIVRNLSFKITEELLQEEMSKFGKVSEVSIARNKENKMLGYAFVAFVNKFEANKAIQRLNGKELLERKVAVDWAVPKEEYQNSLKKNQPKEEEADEDAEDEDAADPEEEGDDEEEDEAEAGESEDDPEDDSMSVDLGSDEEKEGEESEEHVKKDYNDIHEGRTLFIGNLPFDTEKEDVQELFATFGDLRYVRFVYDYEKDRPKGIAFLQFTLREDADKCLASVDDTPLSIGGREISVSRAIDKNSTESMDPKVPAAKDNRNLHLASEGIIKKDSAAEQGVSELDMKKRKQAMEDKKKKLKSLNMFVSTTRLCVRNMPATYTENDLKKLMATYGGVGQVKIMRDISNANTEGVGRSMGYGFVQFQKHETALKALRSVNNNPNIFGPNKRPIVDFSIENSNIIKQREKKFKEYKEAPKLKKSFNQRWQENRLKKQSKVKPEKLVIDTAVKSKAIPDADYATAGAELVRKSKKNKKRKSETPAAEAEAPKTEASSVVKKSKPNKKPKQDQQQKDIDKGLDKILTSEPTSDIAPAKKNKSLRDGKKQKRDKENTKEAQFQSLVSSYKSKLITQETKEVNLKKWYED